MKKIISYAFISVMFGQYVFAYSMFDENGRYNYNSVEAERNRYMRDSAASAAARYYDTRRQEMIITPYRYNSLDYTRVRKRESDTEYYSAKCTDIGDASFCQ